MQCCNFPRTNHIQETNLNEILTYPRYDSAGLIILRDILWFYDCYYRVLLRIIFSPWLSKNAGRGGKVTESVKKAICSCPCSKLLWNPHQKFLPPAQRLFPNKLKFTVAIVHTWTRTLIIAQNSCTQSMFNLLCTTQIEWTNTRGQNKLCLYKCMSPSSDHKNNKN